MIDTKALRERLRAAEDELVQLRYEVAVANGAVLKDSRSPAAFGGEEMNAVKECQLFANELRKWWAFDDCQRHTHSWHSREDFISRELPSLLEAYAADEISTLRSESALLREENAILKRALADVRARMEKAELVVETARHFSFGTYQTAGGQTFHTYAGDLERFKSVLAQYDGAT